MNAVDISNLLSNETHKNAAKQIAEVTGTYLPEITDAKIQD